MSGEVGLPAIPTVEEELLTSLAGSQSVVEVTFGALATPVRRAAGAWLFDVGCAGLAALTPSLGGVSPPLLPAPRAFLDSRDLARLDGARWALEHVAIRDQLRVDGRDTHLLRAETPYILHALAEGRETGEHETNPGTLRVAASFWRDRRPDYEQPDHRLVRANLDLLVEAAAVAEDPPPVVGAWLAFTLLSLHPFLDGNGRVARLLFLLFASRPDCSLMDLGALEQLAIHRADYIDALRAGQFPARTYRPDALLPEPFVRFMLSAAIHGADRTAGRLRAVEQADRRLEALISGLTEPQREVALRVWLERVLAPEQLVHLVVEDDDWHRRNEAMRPLEELVAGGVLERLPLPPSRRRPGWRGIGYRLTPVVLEGLGRPLTIPA